MGIFIGIIIVLVLAYILDGWANNINEEFKPYYEYKEITLIGHFYCDPRVKVSKGKNYLVLDEEAMTKQVTTSCAIPIRFCLIKDDENKLSWVNVSHFKIVEP